MIFPLILMIGLTQGPTTPLTGTVVSPDGTPVVGAELVLTKAAPGESPVAVRGTSGEGGRFRLDRPADLAPIDQYIAPVLWVVAPGHRAARLKFSAKVPGADEPVRVVLGPPARIGIRVDSPDGAPFAGARVNVQEIKGEPMPIPEPVADLTERTTGADGVAVLESFGPEEVGHVDVIARGYGIQPRWLDPDVPGPKRVTLEPVGSLEGRLVADQGEARLVQRWRVRAWTNRQDPDPWADRMSGYGEPGMTKGCP